MVSLTVVVFFVILLLNSIITLSNAGECFEVFKAETNMCMYRIMTNITKQDCCDLEEAGGTSFGWTAVDASPTEMFKEIIMSRGTPGCVPCRATCSDVECGPDKRCKMKNGRPRCVCNLICSTIDDEYDGPVCATNDRTYDRPCSLYRSRCRLRDHFEIAYYGVCSNNSCEYVQCPDGRHCIQDQNNRPHCVECWSTCDNAILGYVCGSDNITYENKCHLQRYSCLHRPVTKVEDSKCNGTSDTCEFTSCADGNKCIDTVNGAMCINCDFTCNGSDHNGNVCGTDMNTYIDKCDLMTEQCRHNPYLKLASYGTCETPISEEDIIPRLVPAHLPPFIINISENKATDVDSIAESNNDSDLQDQVDDGTTTYFADILQNTTVGRVGNKRRNRTKKHNRSTKPSSQDVDLHHSSK